MARNKLVLSMLALSFAAAGICAESAPAGTSPTVANAVDTASIQALRKMGAFLQSLQRFQGLYVVSCGDGVG